MNGQPRLTWVLATMKRTIDSENDDNCAEGDDVEEVIAETETRQSKVFKADSCRIMLLQLCNCRNAAGCTCVPDERIKDTIFYRRNDSYDAETIKGCSTMFAYRFLSRRRYIVHIRQYSCETCAACIGSRSDDERYKNCRNLATVKASGYKCAGYVKALGSQLCRTTGWVEHRIRPLTISSIASTRSTNGLSHLDHRARLKYVGKMKPGDNIFMANIDAGMTDTFKPRHFWLAQLLPLTVDAPVVVWRTRKELPRTVRQARIVVRSNGFIEFL